MSLSLLNVPGEIRNKIYHHLYESAFSNVGRPETIIPFNGEVGLASVKCDGLLALMRTNRQLHAETTSFLYAPLYIFHDSNTDWNVNFILNGPGRHLRRVEFLSSERLIWWFTGPHYSQPTLETSIRNFEALASVAVSLESLEIAFSREFAIYSTAGGQVIRIPEYSWMDPPVELPVDLFQVLTSVLNEEQIRQMVEYVRGIAKNQREQLETIEKAMIENELYRQGVWRRLDLFQDHKRFFGGTMLDILARLGPAIQTIDMCGTVDLKWMRALAVRAGVTVRAQEAEGEEWVVVKPGPSK